MCGAALSVRNGPAISIASLKRDTFNKARKFKRLRIFNDDQAPHDVDIETGLFASENWHAQDILDPIRKAIHEADVELFSHRQWCHAFSNHRLSVVNGLLHLWSINPGARDFDYTGIQVGVQVAGHSGQVAMARQPRRFAEQRLQAALDDERQIVRSIEGFLDTDTLNFPSARNPRTKRASDRYKYIILLYGFHEMNLKFRKHKRFTWLGHLDSFDDKEAIPIRSPLPLAEVGGLVVLSDGGEVYSIAVGISRRITIKYTKVEKKKLQYDDEDCDGAHSGHSRLLGKSLYDVLKKDVELSDGQAYAISTLLREEYDRYHWLQYLG